MAEFTKKFWRCDHCGREVQRGVMPPPGWFEAIWRGPDWVLYHACNDAECRSACLAFLKREYREQCGNLIKELEATCPPT